MDVLDGRAAIIAGVGRGIGAAIARAYAREGVAVVRSDLGTSADGTGGDKSLVQEIVEEINCAGGRALAEQPSKLDVLSAEMAPENIAPLAVYIRSDRSGWLSGRTLSAGGYEVGLCRNPEIIRQLNGTRPWECDRLADLLERRFRSAANGLPLSMFAPQAKGVSHESDR